MVVSAKALELQNYHPKCLPVNFLHHKFKFRKDSLYNLLIEKEAFLPNFVNRTSVLLPGQVSFRYHLRHLSFLVNILREM